MFKNAISIALAVCATVFAGCHTAEYLENTTDPISLSLTEESENYFTDIILSDDNITVGGENISENTNSSIFAANDIHSESEIGGLYVGVCDTPYGPFKNHLKSGGPLINAIYNRAQPIDAHLFKDDDGSIYLYYGGWRHMMVCKMNDTMDGFEAMPEPSFGGIAKEITPDSYVEAPYVMKLDGKYHLMYSTGSWTNGTYCVKAAVSDSPLGEFSYYADVLKASELADGPGHNSAFCFDGQWYVSYHRRTVGDLNPHHRRLCIDKLDVSGGKLHPVVMTE